MNGTTLDSLSNKHVVAVAAVTFCRSHEAYRRSSCCEWPACCIQIH